MTTVARWIPVGFWMLTIFYLSSQSAPPSPPGPSDELYAVIGHLFAYGVLAVLMSLAVSGLRRPDRRTMTLAVAVATTYGVTDEIHQSFVPGRHADPLDLLADFVGATVAVITWSSVLARQQS